MSNPEINLLGLVIKKPDLIDHCQIIRNFDNPFSLQAYNEIWLECLRQYSETGSIEKKSLIQSLKEKNIGFETVLSVIKESGFPESLHEYKTEVYSAFVRRRLTSLSMHLASCGSDQFVDVDGLIDTLRKELEYLESNSAVSIGVTLEQAVQEVKKKASLSQKDDTNIYLRTGILSLDRLIHGLTKKTMSVIGARPSVGKSALGLTILSNMAAAGHSVGFISVEMSEAECTERVMQVRSGVSIDEFRSPQMNDARADKFFQSGDYLVQSGKVQIERTTDRRISNIRSIARRMKTKNPDLKVIFIDYLQKILGDGKQENKRNEVGQVSGIITDMATDLDIHICCLAQINRAGDEEPRMKDLKESGDIEQDAHYIILIHRDLADQFEGKYDCDSTLFVCKNRGGRTGKVEVKYNCLTTRFYDEMEH